MNCDKQDRYQYQPWYVKLWRRRHYLLIPFSALYMWLRGSFDKCKFRFCWSIAKGMAQCNMNWVYDWEEVKERLDKKVKGL